MEENTHSYENAMNECHFTTLDGHKVIHYDLVDNYQTLEITPDADGLCIINLNNISSIDGMTVSLPHLTVDLMNEHSILIRTTSQEDGSVVFWKNWYWLNNSAFDAKIVIKCNVTITVKLHIKQDNIKFVPIFVEGQTFVPKMFENTEYNNALMFMDGQVVLRYVS